MLGYLGLLLCSVEWKTGLERVCHACVCKYIQYSTTFLHTYIQILKPTYIPTYIYTYLHTYTFAYTYTQIHTHVYINIYIHTCICVYIHFLLAFPLLWVVFVDVSCTEINIPTYKQSYIRKGICTRIYTVLHACMHACMHLKTANRHTDRHACTHKQAHTCTTPQIFQEARA